MIEYFKQYLANRKNKRELCGSILGNEQKVREMAVFWDEHYDDFMIISSYYLNEYITDNEFTKEEMTAYKKWLSEIAVFMNKCSKERDSMENLGRI